MPELAQLASKDIHAPWTASAEALRRAGVQLGQHYPAPVVRHDLACAETLERYAVVKQAA